MGRVQNVQIYVYKCFRNQNKLISTRISLDPIFGQVWTGVQYGGTRSTRLDGLVNKVQFFFKNLPEHHNKSNFHHHAYSFSEIFREPIEQELEVFD